MPRSNFALFLPAAGLGSRLSRLIHKPIVRVDGVNTALALTLDAASAVSGAEGDPISIGPIAIAVDRFIARRLLREPETIDRWADGDLLPIESLDSEACRSLTGRPPEALALVVSPADGNGAAWLRAMDALEARDGQLPEYCLAVNSDFPSLALPAYADAARAVLCAAVSAFDPVSGTRVEKPPEVVVAAKSPMVEGAVVAKGSVRTALIDLGQSSIVVPSALVEWSAMSPDQREEARELNRRSLSTAEPQHFLNTTILALRIADVRWYMQRIIQPYLYVLDKGKRELHYVPAVALAHRAYQIEDWLRSLSSGDFLGEAEILAALGKPTLGQSLEDVESDYLDLHARFFSGSLGPDELERHALLQAQIIDRILLGERVMPSLVDEGLFEAEPEPESKAAGRAKTKGQAKAKAKAKGWRRAPESEERPSETFMALPRTRLVSLGVDAPAGVKDVGRMLRFETDMLNATREQLRDLGVEVDHTTRVRLIGGLGADVKASLSSIIRAKDPSSICLRGDVVLSAGVEIFDDVRIDGQARAVFLAEGSRIGPSARMRPRYLGTGMGDMRLRSSWEARLSPSVSLRPKNRELWSDLPGLERLQLHDGAQMRLGFPELTERPSARDLRELVRNRLPEIFELGKAGFVDQVHLFGDVFLDSEVRIGTQAVVLKNTWLIGRTRVDSGCGLDGVIAINAYVRGGAPVPDDFEMPDLRAGEDWMMARVQIVDRHLEGKRSR